MSNKKLFDRSKGKLFKPRFSRSNSQASSTLSSQTNESMNNSEFKNTNLNSTSSYRYGDKPQLVSTQQLRIDWSRFENHTFFHSAVANVNESFDRIINFYPFEKSEKEVEIFEDNLTGYEKYILDSFPKNTGYLNFSGTAPGESLSNGTQISVSDRRGVSVQSISDKSDGAPVLDPKKSPFSIEVFINSPSKANSNQIILQKYSSLSHNFTLALSESSNANTCEVHFGITSGSANLYVTSSLKKGEFNHVFVGYDKKGDQKRWSFCEYRWSIIESKKALASAAVDGLSPTSDNRLTHKKALDYLNCPNIIIDKPNELSDEVDGIILPGVGAFDAAMNSLQISNFINPIKDMFPNIVITSVYRSVAVNSAIGGVENSQHIYGYAADLIILRQPTSTLFNWCKLNIPEYHQLIWEYPERGDFNVIPAGTLKLQFSKFSWIHISYIKGDNPKINSVSSTDPKIHNAYEDENTFYIDNFTHKIAIANQKILE